MRSRGRGLTVRVASLAAPTLTKQCWGFMIGASFFAVGSAPGITDVVGSTGSNVLYFVGAWFFTTAGLVQVALSGPVPTRGQHGQGRRVRAEWLSAAIQSLGTILFNLSTTAALHASSVAAQEQEVWSPDAAGSVAFLVSGALAFVAFAHAGLRRDVRSRPWWSVVVNAAGCVAFGVSAGAAFVLPSGHDLDVSVANGSTFVGAVCFLVASLLVLPAWDRAPGRSPAGRSATASD